MIWIAVLALLLTPMQVAVIYILGRYALNEAKGPLGRLREPEIRFDFFWLMLASGLFTAGLTFLLARYLPGG